MLKRKLTFANILFRWFMGLNHCCRNTGVPILIDTIFLCPKSFSYTTHVWKERTSIAIWKYQSEVYNGINDFYTNDKLPFYSILLFIRFINGIDFSKKERCRKVSIMEHLFRCQFQLVPVVIWNMADDQLRHDSGLSKHLR